MNLSRGFEPSFFSTDRPPLDRLFPTLSLSLSAEHTGKIVRTTGFMFPRLTRGNGTAGEKDKAKFVQGR